MLREAAAFPFKPSTDPCIELIDVRRRPFSTSYLRFAVVRVAFTLLHSISLYTSMQRAIAPARDENSMRGPNPRSMGNEARP